jgi:Zn-dependent protease with chaperone function/hemoglobin-like flavoprotein
MNFFESQQRARSRTLLLVTLFVLALVILIILTNLLLIFAVDMYYGGGLQDPQTFIQRMDWWTFAMIGLGVSIVVFTGSVSKIISLWGGGQVIADSLGARLIQRNTIDLHERQLLNVVEEMAIASGTPAPPVYLLADEAAINAFAAGYSPRDAIIGVTQGLIEHLNRDQLQGVIAHEFSHIFNGDMRLNIQLIGALNGILIIGRIGYQIASSPFRHRRSGIRVRSSGKGKGGGIAVILAIGVGLLIIGYSGIFFGNLIKAAVSRQREYLADASSVQFTRNPEGIAGALKKIGGLGSGSRVSSPGATEISHAFFANGVSGFMSSLWATHPPLEARIRRIDPKWNGQFMSAGSDSGAQVARSDPDQSSPPLSALTSNTTLSEINHTIDRAGAPGEQAMAQARQLISAIPPLLEEAAREPWGARALIYGLLLDREFSERVRQLEYLQNHADRDVYILLQKLMNDRDSLEARFRLPLIDLALPSLKQLSNRQYQTFRDNIVKLIKMDSSVNLMEWSLQKILFNHLDQYFYNLPHVKTRFNTSSELQNEITLVLSVMAYAGHHEREKIMTAFDEACRQMGLNEKNLLNAQQISVALLDQAVQKLQQLKPAIKQQLLKACATGVMFDRHVTAREIELLRAFADVLDCPMPMLDAKPL